MKYCILGAGGAFGLETARYLTARGHDVVGIGRQPLRPDYFSLGAARMPRFRYHAYHLLTELRFIQKILMDEWPDVIINFAAQGEGAVSWENADMFFETNCTALVRLVEWLSKTRDEPFRFIQIGSSEVYGSVINSASETVSIYPSSPYSASKAGFDLYLLAMVRTRGLRATLLRPCNCYCPGQALHRVIPRAVIAGLTGRRLPLHGGGRAEKSYLHARDLARAIHLVAEAPRVGAVYNVGSESPISIRSLLNEISKHLAIRPSDLYEDAPERVGQDARYWLDSTAIREAVGWRPTVALGDGIDEMIAWGKKYLPHLRDLPTDYVMRG